jgi:hypothetical protein
MCVNSVCNGTCNPGFADCDHNLQTNGCEVDLNNDPLNCNGCGIACPSQGGTATCTGGVCGIVCSPGFADCDHNPANGCEIDIYTDPANCGGCGMSACQTTAPAAQCVANTVVTYSAPGACAAGMCAYPSNVMVCPNGGGCFNVQCTTAPTFEGNVAAYTALIGTQIFPPDAGSTSSQYGVDFYTETSPKGSEKAVHVFYSTNGFGGPYTDVVMSFYQWIGSNDQWKGTVPPQLRGTTVWWYIRYDHYDGSEGYYSNFGANFHYVTN